MQCHEKILIPQFFLSNARLFHAHEEENTQEFVLLTKSCEMLIEPGS